MAHLVSVNAGARLGKITRQVNRFAVRRRRFLLEQYSRNVEDIIQPGWWFAYG